MEKRILVTRLGNGLLARAENRLKPLLRACLLRGATRRQSHLALRLMRWANGIQLNDRELRAIATSVVARRPCRMLVFGVGNDSSFWSGLNRSGVTAFLEHSASWIEVVKRRRPDLSICHVEYSTRQSEWAELLGSTSDLKLSLPDHVENEQWDIILIDGPPGAFEDDPGRMQSIATASTLVSPLADVFVHDCNRTAERTYADEYLGSHRLLSEVGRLRHYRFMPDDHLRPTGSSARQDESNNECSLEVA